MLSGSKWSWPSPSGSLAAHHPAEEGTSNQRRRFLRDHRGRQDLHHGLPAQDKAPRPFGATPTPTPGPWAVNFTATSCPTAELLCGLTQVAHHHLLLPKLLAIPTLLAPNLLPLHHHPPSLLEALFHSPPALRLRPHPSILRLESKVVVHCLVYQQALHQ